MCTRVLKWGMSCKLASVFFWPLIFGVLVRAYRGLADKLLDGIRQLLDD